jgi:uncharacterized protein (TIGR03435 family)
MIHLMKNSLKSVFVVCAVATLCVAQISETNIPHFEVASVKPSSSREIGGAYTYPGGRVAFRGCTFLYLVQLAFDLQEFQIAVKADWMKTDRFDIDATVPPASRSRSANPPTPKTSMNDEQRRMLQSMLAERFDLRYRQDTTEGPVYLLTRNGKALKMADAKDKKAFPWSGGPSGGMIMGDGLRGINESMSDLARRLSPYMGRSVLDRTGLPGSFDFETRYSVDDQRPDVISMILTCLNDIGLKLKPSKGQVERIIIEQAQRPTAN